METIKKTWFAPSMLGACLVISAVVFSFAFYLSRVDTDVLSVTGSSKVSVKADLAKWTISFSRIVPQSSIKTGYDLMAKDLQIVNKYFKDAGVADTDLNISPVFMDQNYDYSSSKTPGSEKEYTLRQTVQLSLADVQKMTLLAKNTRAIVDGGVLLSPNSVEYYYTKLPDLRVSLLSDAIKDAQNRAEKLTGSTGRMVGVLKSASSGVVQVLPLNSLEVSDYGSYDTGSIDKDVMITVRATFNIK
jgi:uncharacterized protein